MDYQRSWLPFGQILADTTDVPFYFSGITFSVFFRFPDTTDDAKLPFLFCKGSLASAPFCLTPLYSPSLLSHLLYSVGRLGGVVLREGNTRMGRPRSLV
jgi:hypothetical protein